MAGEGLLPFRAFDGTGLSAHRYKPWQWLLRGLFASFHQVPESRRLGFAGTEGSYSGSLDAAVDERLIR